MRHSLFALARPSSSSRPAIDMSSIHRLLPIVHLMRCYVPGCGFSCQLDEPRRLAAHVEQHPREATARPWVHRCALCAEISSDTDSANVHLHVDHNVSAARLPLPTCRYCGQRFVEAAHLAEHCAWHDMLGTGRRVQPVRVAKAKGLRRDLS